MALECERVEPEQLERLLTFARPLLVEIETAHERRLVVDYLAGLVGPAERKTPEPMVRAQFGVDRAPSRERRLQEMLSDGSWNHLGLTLLGAERLMRDSPEFEAYTLDDTAVLKQGSHSVGVANQYAGCLGGLANCQVIVTVGVASEHVSSLIAAQLFLPASWCQPEADKRRAACRIPPSIQHRTKHAIGLSLVDEIAEWGLPKRPWLCDSAYGDNTAFRHAMAQRQEQYVAGVSLSLTMWPVGTSFAVPENTAKSGRARFHLQADGGRRPQSVVTLAADLPAEAWRPVLWRHGSRGPQQGRFAAVRVRPAKGLVRNNHCGFIHPRDLQPEQWLLIHWPEGEPKPTKAWLSNLPETAPIERLVALGRLRWRIERDHEEGKGLVGFDHYEGRTWPGLHHHLALVLVAEQFLACERLRELREAPSSPAASAAFPPCAVGERAPSNRARSAPSGALSSAT